MRVLQVFEDDCYPDMGVEHERRSVRGIVLDASGKVALLRCHGPVSDGHMMDCYLTPGGGMELGETKEMTVRRELGEELGIEIEILSEVGCIVDRYNNIRQRNLVYYYLVMVAGSRPLQRTDEEDGFITTVEWLPIDEAIWVLNTYPADPRGLTLHRRDRMALLEAKRILCGLKTIS
ncbi:MAG: NUDIX hydrolase [Bacillota bacterium]